MRDHCPAFLWGIGKNSNNLGEKRGARGLTAKQKKSIIYKILRTKNKSGRVENHGTKQEAHNGHERYPAGGDADP